MFDQSSPHFQLGSIRPIFSIGIRINSVQVFNHDFLFLVKGYKVNELNRVSFDLVQKHSKIQDKERVHYQVNLAMP